MELDFPQNKEVRDKQQNEELQKKYGIEGYPTLVLLDSEGKEIGRTGYRPGGAAGYVLHLDGFLGYREAKKALAGKLAAAKSDAEKLKLYQEVIEVAEKTDQLADAQAEMEAACKLDPQNAAGAGLANAGRLAILLVTQGKDHAAHVALVRKWDPKNEKGYLTRVVLTQAQRAAGGEPDEKKFREAAKLLLDFEKEFPGQKGEYAQHLYVALGNLHIHLKEKEKGVGYLKKAIEAHPGGPLAKRIEAYLQQMKEE